MRERNGLVNILCDLRQDAHLLKRKLEMQVVPVSIGRALVPRCHELLAVFLFEMLSNAEHVWLVALDDIVFLLADLRFLLGPLRIAQGDALLEADPVALESPRLGRHGDNELRAVALLAVDTHVAPAFKDNFVAD